jgi:prepilin-type N-terminal cleavage/methylation domain-containing protein
MDKLKQFLSNKKGFTLSEIMASMVILSVVTTTGAINVAKNLDNARINATIQEMLAIRDALNNYQRDHPGYTITSTSSMSTLITNDYLLEGVTDAPDSDLETDYTEDAWGRDYVITLPTDSKRGSIKSGGADQDLATTSDNIEAALEKVVQ